MSRTILVTWRPDGLVRRNQGNPSRRLIFTVVLALAVTAAGHDPSESFLRHGTELLHRGFFADSVAMFTRALEQNPKDVKACYYQALANEMVDRQAAIGDWRKFVELVATNPDSKEEVTQAEERLRALEAMPALPESLRPSRYVPRAGDYYQEVAGPSVGLQWTQFPVKVFADSPPEEGRRALEKALAAWMNVFPLQMVSAREGADIVLSWAKLPKGTLGRERDLIQVRNEDDRLVRRKKSFISLDNSPRWSEREMRAVVLHELGHALGIEGHSDDSRDVMFDEEVTILHLVQEGASGFYGTSSSTGINTKLTPRDVNTLIRLYNCPGPLVHLK
jgi:predicted Zn-dependent protease